MIREPRSYGADDTPACPECGRPMMLTRRSPREGMAGEETQTMTCPECRHEMERDTKEDGSKGTTRA